MARPNLEWHYPLCTGGARAAPPDDVGGPAGYVEFLAAIKDPKHEEHESMLVWIGGAFDPEGFDLNTSTERCASAVPDMLRKLHAEPVPRATR